MVNIRFVHVLSHFCLVYFTMVSSSHSALFSTFSSQLNLYQVLLIFVPLFSSTLNYYNSLQSQSSYFSSSIAPPLFLILILVFAFLQSAGVVDRSWKRPIVARPLHLKAYIVLLMRLMRLVLMIRLVMMMMRLVLMKRTLQNATVPTMSSVTAASSCHCKLKI